MDRSNQNVSDVGQSESRSVVVASIPILLKDLYITFDKFFLFNEVYGNSLSKNFWLWENLCPIINLLEVTLKISAWSKHWLQLWDVETIVNTSSNLASFSSFFQHRHGLVELLWCKVMLWHGIACFDFFLVIVGHHTHDKPSCKVWAWISSSCMKEGLHRFSYLFYI